MSYIRDVIPFKKINMFNIFKKKEKEKPTFMDLLERSEYFEFTDKDQVQELKNTIQNSYEKYRAFNTTYNNSRNPNCKKAYFCDSETVFKGWGFKVQLKIMQEGFEKITNYNELINQIPESYDYESNPKGDWFDAVAYFTKQINKYLEESASNYKCYPAYGGNDGSMYLLNELQYLLLNKAIKDEHTQPMELNDWIAKYKQKEIISNTNSETQIKQLQEGMKIKHIKFGVGQIIEINEKGVANIRFEDRDRRIILKYAKLEIVK